MKIYLFVLLGIVILVSLFSIYAKQRRDKNLPLFKNPDKDTDSSQPNEKSSGSTVKKTKSKDHVAITDYLGIEDIEKGIFHLENNEYCVVIEASFVNYDLKSNANKKAILMSYQSLFRVVKFPIQILGQSVSQDMRKEEARFEENLASKHAAVQKYNRDILKNIKDRSENEFRVTKRLYYLLRYAPVENKLGSLSSEKRKKMIETNLSMRASTVIAMLRGAEVSAYLLDSLKAMEVVKRALNRNRMNNHPIEDVVNSEKLATYVTLDISSIPGMEDLVNDVEELADVIQKYIPEEEQSGNPGKIDNE